MATQREVVEHIVRILTRRAAGEGEFAFRAMFGEYALYCNGKVVALICDDTLYVKIVPESAALAEVCEQGHPYPGSRPHYVVSEGEVDLLPGLAQILVAIAVSLPERKKKEKKKSNVLI